MKQGVISLLLLVICLPFLTSGQSLQRMGEFPIVEGDKWFVDGLNNVYVSSNSSIVKYNDAEKVVFKQSLKKSGSYDQIGMVNTLKLYAFSENQQQICFFDNSLTPLDQCIDLSDYDLVDVHQAASSSQSDKIWVLDQINSTLNLLTFNQLFQKQQLKNLTGILHAESITQMLEFENKLYLLNPTEGIYKFDAFGTLVNFYEIADVQWFQCFGNYLICLKDNQLVISSLTDEKKLYLPLEVASVKRFFVNDTYLYLEVDQKIVKTKLNFEE